MFRRDGETLRHFWATELLYAAWDQEPRHVDLMWPIWNVLDMTPDGRGGGDIPMLRYD